ncbi:MAG TPA: Glu/Leu/Phe/Val dehydrogenase dimerization domain-containing protein [Candidatus Polarisedimenticolia bacterium]|nr:Glu/Leu/Phe/Val dehydrogenase dimerization domain-containing protein [Candidatus Polarisedimenticolia bacterium]
MAWDGEEELREHDAETGAWIVIAIHSTRLGPAVGGTRMKPYPTPEEAETDARRLSAAMTLKMAASGMPWGGGKGVLAVPAGLTADARRDLLHRYGRIVASLGGRYHTAPDVGTTSDDMDRIREAAGPLVFGCTEANGGSGPSGPATALGVHAAIRVTCEEAFGSSSLAGRAVLVQGAGSVGGALIERLLADGARVSFSDVQPDAVRRFRERGVPFVEPAAVIGAACDVFSPCALGGVLTAEATPRLRCRAVAGGANNQLADEAAAEALAARGILYAPDFIANSGGACSGIHMEADGWPRERAERDVEERVSASLRAVFVLARERRLTTDAAARAIARRRLDRDPRP